MYSMSIALAMLSVGYQVNKYEIGQEAKNPRTFSTLVVITEQSGR